MRADRLLSIMLLLQARGKLTAQALAAELEVSERTIYRDVEALGMAGVPVYSESGPGGGIGLLESYRTTLAGLTDAEAAAFFLLSIPAPLEDVDLSADLRSALRKIAAALPATQRDAQQAKQHVFVDATGWGAGAEPTPHLSALHAAVVQAQPLTLRYRRLSGAAVTTAVEPYGLVAKAGVWLCRGCAHRTGAAPRPGALLWRAGRRAGSRGAVRRTGAGHAPLDVRFAGSGAGAVARPGRRSGSARAGTAAPHRSRLRRCTGSDDAEEVACLAPPLRSLCAAASLPQPCPFSHSRLRLDQRVTWGRNTLPSILGKR